MPHRLRCLVPVLLAVLATSSCVDITTPYDENLERTQLGDRIGKAHWQSILGLFAWGDAGTRAAAEEGGITMINHADVETFAVLWFLYVKRTTVVYGTGDEAVE